MSQPCYTAGHEFIWSLEYSQRLDIPRLFTLATGIGLAAAAAIVLRK